MTHQSKITLLGVVGTMLMASSQALAAPSAEPHCSKVLSVPAGTAGATFDDACDTAYLLPPVQGSEQVTAVATNTNLNFCPGVLKITDVVNTTLASADTIAQKISALIAAFNPMTDQLLALENQMSAASAASTAATQNVLNDQTTEANDVTAVSNAQNALTTCEALGGDCTTEQAAVTSAQADLRSFIVNTLTPDQQAQTAAQATYNTLSAEVQNQTTSVTDALAPLTALETQLSILESTVMEQYAQFAPLSGLSAQIEYSIPWDTLFQKFQSANPGVNFQQLPIVSTNFFAAVDPSLTASTGGNIPTVLGFTIPGMPSVGASHFPTGLGSIQPLGSATLGADVSQASMPFGTSVSASVVYSLLGACNFYPNGALAAPVGNINNLVADMPANLTYQYELTAHRGYTARYNLSQFASKLVTVQHKGGFFTSTDITNIVESANSSDWFTITFNVDTSAFAYTDAEKSRITIEAKGQLVERALQLLAVQNGVLGGAPTGNPALSPTGAGGAASYLSAGCGYWSWCGATSFVLGVLNSIFGSETAVQNFQKANNVWVTDTVNDETVLLRQGALTFAPNQQ